MLGKGPIGCLSNFACHYTSIGSEWLVQDVLSVGQKTYSFAVLGYGSYV